MYLFANEGENHTNNVKQLEEMKKGTEDTRGWESYGQPSQQSENLNLKKSKRLLVCLGLKKLATSRHDSLLWFKDCQL